MPILLVSILPLVVHVQKVISFSLFSSQLADSAPQRMLLLREFFAGAILLQARVQTMLPENPDKKRTLFPGSGTKISL